MDRCGLATAAVGGEVTGRAEQRKKQLAYSTVASRDSDFGYVVFIEEECERIVVLRKKECMCGYDSG